MRIFITVMAFLCCTLKAYSQFNDSLKANYYPERPKEKAISFCNYFQQLKGNFMQQALSPFHTSGANWIKVGGFAVFTAGVMEADEAINHLSVKFHAESSLLRAVSPRVTKFGGRYMLYTFGAIGAWSYIFKNQKLKNTTLLATQSYLTSGIWAAALKWVSGRARPSYYNPLDNENESIWHGLFFQYKRNSAGERPDGAEYSAFPSGHATAAFAVATVYAEEYKNKPWVPVIAYSSASLIALSRITENKHWASDVFVGSVLGYVCGKQVVRNFHRLERLNSLMSRKKNILEFNFRYVNRLIMPEFIYTFR